MTQPETRELAEDAAWCTLRFAIKQGFSPDTKIVLLEDYVAALATCEAQAYERAVKVCDLAASEYTLPGPGNAGARMGVQACADVIRSLSAVRTTPQTPKP